MHLVHMPLQVPDAWLANFSHIDDNYRRLMHAMAAYLDNDVGLVVAELKDRGYWDNTLVIFHADNGGEIMGAGICGGNNWPLRGGKFSNWEGGIRVNAFVTGGALPASRRGAVESGLIAGWDWFATYVPLASFEQALCFRFCGAGTSS
jgi:arylsulfatase I/J